MKPAAIATSFLILFLLTTNSVYCGDAPSRDMEPVAGEEESYDPFLADEDGLEDPLPAQIADPIEGYNRKMFVLNDWLYFYSLEPTARAYAYVLPEPARKCIKRFFINTTTPGRFVNCLLQGKIKGAGIELSRLVINTTIGIGGLFDPARNYWNLSRNNEDTGQTFGHYGMGHGFYFVLPLLGPSSGRDALGTILDFALDPLLYVNIKLWENGTIRFVRTVNDSSLILGEYEDLKKAAIDPYISLRNAFVQYRKRAVAQ